MTNQITIPAGEILLAELQEFGTFPAETQRYIRRALDVAFDRSDPIDRWSRTGEEAAEIRAQMHIYDMLGRIRQSVPGDTQRADAVAFFAPLVAVSVFDLGAGKLPTFSAFRFLYERLLGAAARPWLPSVFSAAAAMPMIDPARRRELIISLGDALTTGWSAIEASFYPEWIEPDSQDPSEASDDRPFMRR